MIKETLSGLSLVAAAFGLAVLSAPASAACSDTADEWDCINDNGTAKSSVTAEYTGTATLYHWYTGTIWCNDVRATGTVDIQNDGSADLSISAFSSSNSTNNPDCSNVGFSNFNWTGSHSGVGSPSSDSDATPASFTVGTVVIDYNGTTVCNDSTVEVDYANKSDGSGSVFDFDTSISGWSGSCSIDGTLSKSGITAH